MHFAVFDKVGAYTEGDYSRRGGGLTSVLRVIRTASSGVVVHPRSSTCWSLSRPMPINLFVSHGSVSLHVLLWCLGCDAVDT